MEILSVSFAVFVVKLALCIVPAAIGVRLCFISSDVKDETRQKISQKLLGDPSLFDQGFFNFVLYFMTTMFILAGLIIALIFFL